MDERLILDGIHGSVSKYHEGVVQEKLLIRSPDREAFELDYKILDAFFELVEPEVNDREDLMEYVEDIKSYFDYGLPIRQVSEDPLEFRFWGAITANEVEDLYSFFATLPASQPIIFDCRNFPAMGNMFHVDFEELNDSHQLYYLVKAGKTPRDLLEIGNCAIYTDRESIFEAIQQRNEKR